MDLKNEIIRLQNNNEIIVEIRCNYFIIFVSDYNRPLALQMAPHTSTMLIFPGESFVEIEIHIFLIQFSISINYKIGYPIDLCVMDIILDNHHLSVSLKKELIMVLKVTHIR